MKNKILILLAVFSTIICSSQTKYYKETNGKILNAIEYNQMKNESLINFKKIDSDMNLFEENKEIRRNKDSIVYQIKLFGMSNSSFKEKKAQKKLIGKKFPFEKLTTIDGNKINLDDLKGKPTLVNFWFTNCYPCIEEIPILNQISKEFKEKINFISITYDGKQKVLKLLEKIKYDFIQVTDSKYIMKEMGVKTYPQNFIIDKNGYINSIEGGIEYKDISVEKPIIGDGKEMKERLMKILSL